MAKLQVKEDGRWLDLVCTSTKIGQPDRNGDVFAPGSIDTTNFTQGKIRMSHPSGDEMEAAPHQERSARETIMMLVDGMPGDWQHRISFGKDTFTCKDGWVTAVITSTPRGYRGYVAAGGLEAYIAKTASCPFELAKELQVPYQRLLDVKRELRHLEGSDG